MNTDEKQEDTQASESHSEEVTQEAETSKETESNDVDYQKELDLARQALEKKDKQLGQAEHVIEKLKSEGSEVNTATIEELIERKFQSFTQQVRGDAIDGLIGSYSSNDDEAALIKHHLENSIKPSGDDVTDIINAKALANKARFTQQTSEIKRAKMQTEADNATTAGQKEESKTKPRLSAQDKAIMKAYGLTEEELQKGVR